LVKDSNWGYEWHKFGLIFKGFYHMKRTQLNKMQKRILFYSYDFSYGLSLLMFFSDNYYVTSTTDLDSIPKMFSKNKYDLILIDEEPTDKVLSLCKYLKEKNPNLIIILTCAYKLKDNHKNNKLINKSIDFIFYKPVDLLEISKALHLSSVVYN